MLNLEAIRNEPSLVALAVQFNVEWCKELPHIEAAGENFLGNLCK